MKNRFKIGDCVRHIHTGRAGRVMAVNREVVTCEILLGEKRVVWHISNVMMSEHIPEDKKDLPGVYKFHSSCVLDVDFTLIQSELTNRNPMALVTVGDDTFVVIHKSLRIKATICQIECPNPVHDITKVAMKVSESYSEWIQWAKTVKGATWPDAARNKTTVTVALPTI